VQNDGIHPLEGVETAGKAPDDRDFRWRGIGASFAFDVRESDAG
jgi:hypothetical protein